MTNPMQQSFGKFVLPPSGGEILDTTTASGVLKIAPKTLRRLAKAGRVPYFRVGRLLRFDMAALRAALQDHNGTGS